MQAQRELIIVTRPSTALVSAEGKFVPAPAVAAAAVAEPLNAIMRSANASARYVMGDSAEGIMRDAAAAGLPEMAAGLLKYQRIDAADEDLDGLAAELGKAEGVETVYIKPPTLLPVWKMPEVKAMSALETALPAPMATPDYRTKQGYLAAPPSGINVGAAWNQPGGSGSGIKIIDIEGGWDLEHEDLRENSAGLVAGTNASDAYWRNHGSAVLAEMGGDHNSRGVIGMAYAAELGVVSHMNLGTGAAIKRAANKLRAGDVMLLEMHRPGPAANYQTNDNQIGYIAVEWWPDDLEAIRYATSKGILVVEAAGNGSQDLEDSLYDAHGPSFPASWRNPFKRQGVDSGAIIVGAGGSPAGGNDRVRLGFSNYGSCVDCQGWGEDVVTAGYGDLQNSSDRNYLYTARFSGTSSASPIVAGVLACVQGVLKAAQKPLLAPAQARQLLRSTGSAQRPNGSQRIGPRPDIGAILQQLLP